MLIMLLLGAGWPTDGHDARRTGQSEERGPAELRWTGAVELPEEVAVNMPPVATEAGVLVGSWGLTRSFGVEDRHEWDKADGHLFSFDRALSPNWEFSAELVPWCYDYDGRTDTQCPDGGYWNRYNGTIEGTPAVSEGRVYVGRGDGKLYAVDEETGESIWTFTTFNPEDPADPEGGGEIIGGPLVGPDGAIYFGTAGVGLYETNAIYALNPDGSLRWRYPSQTRGLDAIVWAPFALSPDGATMYAATAWGATVDDFDGSIQGRVFSFDVGAATGSGEERLRWTYTPINTDRWWQPTIWTRVLAVGSDGILYFGGMEATFGGGTAVVYALEDQGDAAVGAWPTYVDVDYDRAQYLTGLALREEGGLTRAVVATSGDRYTAGSFGTGGLLQVMDPSDGAVQWSFNPEDYGASGALSGVAIDAEGRLYTGAGGTVDSGGMVFALDASGAVLWSFATEGMMAWAHPVLGPRGDLYFADFQECALFGLPIEWGFCDNFDITPTLYAVFTSDPSEPVDTSEPDDSPTADDSSDDTSSNDTDDTGGPSKPGHCGCGGGAGSTGGLLGLLAALALRRR